MVDWISGFSVSTAERIATLGVSTPRTPREVDRVLHDLALGVEVGCDVDRGIGDEERSHVGRDIHHEHVTDPPARTEAGLLGDDLLHELIGVEAPLHERLDLTRPRHGDGPLGGLVAVARRHESVRPEVDRLRRGGGADPRLGADEHGDDEPGLRGVDRSQERVPIHRVDDGGDERGETACRRDQPSVARARLVRVNGRHDHAWPRDLLRGRDDLGRAVDDDLAPLAHAATLEGHTVRRGILGLDGHRRRDRFPERHRPPELKGLPEVDRARAGKSRPEQRRDRRCAPDPDEVRLFAGERSHEARRVAHLDLVEGPVLDHVHEPQ